MGGFVAFDTIVQHFTLVSKVVWNGVVFSQCFTVVVSSVGVSLKTSPVVSLYNDDPISGGDTNPIRTAVPFWGQTGQILSNLSPKRDCSPKRVRNTCVVSYSGVGRPIDMKWRNENATPKIEGRLEVAVRNPPQRPARHENMISYDRLYVEGCSRISSQ